MSLSDALHTPYPELLKYRWSEIMNMIDYYRLQSGETPETDQKTVDTAIEAYFNGNS